MIGHISQWGNSLGIRIPGKMADYLGIRPGSDVEITMDKGRIVLTPARRLSVADLLADYPAGKEREISTGTETGAESAEW